MCIALTATATPRVREDIKTSLGFQASDEFVASFNRENLFIRVVPKQDPFEQTVEFLRAAKKEKVKFVVANGARFTPGFNALRDFLKDKKLEDFHLITAVCNVQENIDDPQNRWLSDPQLAGGGVLLRNCYEIIDQIMLNFGIPQQVYSLNTNRAPDKQQRLSIRPSETPMRAIPYRPSEASSDATAAWTSLRLNR